MFRLDVLAISASMLAGMIAAGIAPQPTQSPQPPPASQAPSRQQPPDVTVDAAARAEVIDGALKALDDGYVFPEVAKKMADALRARQKGGEYDAISSGREFAQRLTDHLREVSRDKHLSVGVNPMGQTQGPPRGAIADGLPLTLDERQRINAGRHNFGFMRVERLAGNIGYLDLRAFMPPQIAGDTARAAMTFLSSADAVIFDLRQNGGGSPDMVAYLISFLMGPQPVHLNDFYFRPTDTTRQSWTIPYVAGERFIDRDVYILTSSRTFSGAEEFTYNLKHLKRATIVGETTGGGAHLVQGRRINDRFMIAVPSGRPINAVTKSDWEGTGVEPDVRVTADQALDVAHLIALEQQQRALTADAGRIKNEVETTIESLRAKLGDTAKAAALARTDMVEAMPASRAGDDFESGSLANWRIDRRGSGDWFTYTNGKIAPGTKQSDQSMPFDVPNPPQGKTAAVSDQNSPGRFIMYRDVALDGRYQLRLSVFYVNHGNFSAVTASSRSQINNEQQFRIDIMSPAAPLDSVARDHVLATVFRAAPGDPPRREPSDVTVDLSRWQGQIVRLRVAVAENQAPLRAGVDHLRFERLTP